jgi:hypothetical protein
MASLLKKGAVPRNSLPRRFGMVQKGLAALFYMIPEND